ncbi:MAG TPA: ABC transporter permease [Candidatus Hydrogenedentes bacterium]|nr:ABC transporter permease [Candidatus Hydrogenedentota bacterium]
MSFVRLITRGLTYHRRLHAGLLLGAVLACGILTGALLVGDSVDYSLRAIASARLGHIQYAMEWRNRFFGHALAQRLQEKDPRIRASALLSLKGMASLPPDRKQAGNQLNNVQVIGVKADFWAFAEETSFKVDLGPQEAAINEKTASALGIKPGDDLLLRITKPGTMPLDAPLSSREQEQTVSSLVTVKGVLSDAQLGRFSLATNQTTPFNVFVNFTWLQEETEKAGLANLMVVNGGVPQKDLHHVLAQSWDLEDLGLRLRTSSLDFVQLESSRIFIDEEVLRATQTIPGSISTLTYLVNSISKGDRMTPYSFVEAGAFDSILKDDEVEINMWLAAQLLATGGDTVDMAYLQLLPDNTFVERSRSFKVHGVVLTTEALNIERELAPLFPGLSQVESCTDWRIGMPMDEARLADPANELYWKQYGQTPKLFTTLKAGQEMWGNRFGDVTAVRFPASMSESEVRQTLRKEIAPEKEGLQFLPVGKMALDAVNQAIDFGGLFVGMSFFLIVAALVLLGLLYVFGLQQRTQEMGILLALGYSRNRVRALFFLEACPTAIVGALLGAFAGIAYARLLLAAIAFLWPAAVAGTAIGFHIKASTLLIGIFAATLFVLLVVLAGIWRGTRLSPHQLLTTDFATATIHPARHRRIWIFLLSTIALFCAAATIVYVWKTKPESMVEPFFSVGTFLLLAELGYYASFLGYLARRPTYRHPSLWKMILSNLARRRGRSLSVAGLTACGCFLVFAVSAMQENVALHATERSAGTGGFGIFAETTAPLMGTPEDLLKTLGTKAVPLRVRDGDDAGCLNLNHALAPRLYGVDPHQLSRLGAFVPQPGEDTLWKLLQQPLQEGVVPALAGDSDTAMWGLKKKTGVADGDVLPYHDESGKKFTVKLVGKLPMRLSVFQGSLLISEDAFTRLFPSEAGFRTFLIDTPANKAQETAERLNRDLERFGMQAAPAVSRLHEFYAVEQTYLSMFLLLGGFGLILGAGGTGIVVLRNVFERRSEIALLHALGYERSILLKILLAEHGALVLAGMLLGALAAAAAILPLILLSQTTVSPLVQAVLFAVIVISNLVSISVMVLVGLPQNPTPYLREE